eukprot:scaffold55_cov225-Ochromonas_danica.AAC.4
MNISNRPNTAPSLPSSHINSHENVREEELLPIRVGIPDEFQCPLSRELFDDPVVAADGYSYERRYIEYAASHSRTRQGDGGFFFPSPMTRELISTIFYNNRYLKDAISSWQFKENVYRRKFQSMEEEMRSIELAYNLYCEMRDEKQRSRASALETELSDIERHLESELSAARQKREETLSISTQYFGHLVVFLESLLKNICFARKLTTNSNITLNESITLLHDAKVISLEESEVLHNARELNNKSKHSIRFRPKFSEDDVYGLITDARKLLQLLTEPRAQAHSQSQAVEAEVAVGGRMTTAASTRNTGTALVVESKPTISEERVGTAATGTIAAAGTAASGRGSPGRSSSEGRKAGGTPKAAPALVPAASPFAAPSLNSPSHPPAGAPYPLRTLRDAVDSDCPDNAYSLGKRMVYLALCNTLIEEIRSYLSRGGGPLPAERMRSWLLLQVHGRILNNSVIIFTTLQNGEVPPYVRDFMVENELIEDERVRPVTFQVE